MINRNLGFTASFILVCLTACTDMGSEPEADDVTFSDEIQTIFDHNCNSCHSHIFANPAAGLDLSEGESYDNLVNTSSTFNGLFLVLPGNADSSVLYLKVIGDPQTDDRMPLSGSSLSDVQISNIKTWIDEGAENN
ncbi:MAG TPA: hypothetical protein EYM55_05740 [Candidatus Marinimicrobia bacterium]|nr:hypothetical protein [Candidatus Neomarinimicrobiota bacterium]